MKGTSATTARTERSSCLFAANSLHFLFSQIVVGQLKSREQPGACAGAARLGVLSLQAANRDLLQSLERLAQQQAEASSSSPLAQKLNMLQQLQRPLPLSPPLQQQQVIEAGQPLSCLSPCASLATPESRGMELRAGTPDWGHDSPQSPYSSGEAHGEHCPDVNPTLWDARNAVCCQNQLL